MKLAIDALEKKKLYKFRAIARDPNDPDKPDPNKLHYIERIFTHNELYFSSPVELNDPFESRPKITVRDFQDEGYKKKYVSYVKSLILSINADAKPGDVKTWLESLTQEQAEDLAGEHTEELRNQFFEKYRICSFSGTAKNPLLWSHYSDAHTGFCLEFDASTDIFGWGGLQMQYQDAYPTLDVTEQDDDEILRASILTKYTDWKYEKEYRLVSMEPNVPNALPIRNKKYVFPPELLVGVILGCRIRESDRQLIAEWCSNRVDHPVTLRKAVLSESEYELQIIDLNT